MLIINSSVCQILGKSLSLYILFAFIGLCIGILTGLLICRERNLQHSFVFRMVLFILLIGFIPKAFISRMPSFMLSFSYFAGLFVAVILFMIIGRTFNKNPIHCCEIGLICMNIYFLFSKIGCFFAGCCHGNPYNGFLSVTYTEGTHAFLYGVPLFPVQLADAAARTAIIVIMIAMYYKDIFHSVRLPLFFCLTGICYYWSMFFWYEPCKTVNQNGIDYILIFTILFGAGALLCVLFQLLYNARKTINKSYI